MFTFGDGIILHLIDLACAANARHDLCGTEDDVDAAICANNVAHLSGLECIGGVLERLLHLTLRSLYGDVNGVALSAGE